MIVKAACIKNKLEQICVPDKARSACIKNKLEQMCVPDKARFATHHYGPGVLLPTKDMHR